jgi:hypothetical protein
MSPAQKLHYTELKPARPGDPIGTEWDTYRQEVGRLFAEGHEGKFVLITGTTILGIFASKREALDEGYRHYLLGGFLVQQILTWEPVIRNPNRI